MEKTESIMQSQIKSIMKRAIFTSILPVAVCLILALNACKDETLIPPDNGFNPDITYGTMQDKDGNVYKTVVIGTQTWMAQNLRTSRFNDGTAIPKITGNAAWDEATSGAYCIYDNTTDSQIIADYGYLYNFHAVNSGKLAPNGWHIPTKEEWETLITFAGGAATSGIKLKETGSSHWEKISNNYLITNATGLTALPGGSRLNGFAQMKIYGEWWTSSMYYTANAWLVSMSYASFNTYVEHYGLSRGCSVLCVKD